VVGVLQTKMARVYRHDGFQPAMDCASGRLQLSNTAMRGHHSRCFQLPSGAGQWSLLEHGAWVCCTRAEHMVVWCVCLQLHHEEGCLETHNTCCAAYVMVSGHQEGTQPTAALPADCPFCGSQRDHLSFCCTHLSPGCAQQTLSAAEHLRHVAAKPQHTAHKQHRERMSAASCVAPGAVAGHEAAYCKQCLPVLYAAAAVLSSPLLSEETPAGSQRHQLASFLVQTSPCLQHVCFHGVSQLFPQDPPPQAPQVSMVWEQTAAGVFRCAGLAAVQHRAHCQLSSAVSSKRSHP
jgi:hypothetical protein